MSAKNSYKYHLLVAKSLASSFISDVTNIRNTDNVSYSIHSTGGGSTGNFYIEVSNDYLAQGADVINPGVWVRLTLSGQPVLSGAVDDIGISLNQLPYEAIRLVYESTVAGTGICDAYITAKRLGG